MRVRRLVSTALVAAGLSVAFAAPAQADHVVQVVQVGSGDSCVLGELTTEMGIRLEGRVVQHTYDSSGLTKRFVCRFRGIPSYVSAEDSTFEEAFVMPRNGFTRTVMCMAPAPGGGQSHTEQGRLRVTPSGNATVQCSGFEPVP